MFSFVPNEEKELEIQNNTEDDLIDYFENSEDFSTRRANNISNINQ